MGVCYLDHSTHQLKLNFTDSDVWGLIFSKDIFSILNDIVSMI